ncbi:MAG: GIY-YIG nuclease family protein [bacterium]
MPTVYILQSLKDKKTYIGYTNNFERRFNQHNSGQSKSTKHRSPFKLLFKEEFSNSSEAKKRELWWKSGIGRRKLKEYFNTIQK